MTTDVSAKVGGALPNLFVAGAPKSGTTSLCRSLAAHPDIYLPHLKEPQFFGSDRRGLVTERAAYEALFAPGARVRWRIDGSVLTLSSRDGLGQAVEAVPDARIVCVLRNPVEAVPAFYDQLRRHFAEPAESFAEAWATQDARRAGRAEGPVYADFFDYARQLSALARAVPEARRRVYSFEALRRDGHGVLADLLGVLGLPGPVPEMLHENANRVPRSRGVHRLKHALGHGAGRAKRALGIDRNLGLGRALFAANSAPRQRAPLDPALREELRAYFKADIEAMDAAVAQMEAGRTLLERAAS